MPGQTPFTSLPDFARDLATLIKSPIAQEVFGYVKALLEKKRPEVVYDVTRVSPPTMQPVPTQITLAQIMAELTDAMKVNNILQQQMLQSNAALTFELQKNREIGERLRKQAKRRQREEEEYEEEDE